MDQARILLVEDMQSLREILAELLISFGYACDQTENGDVACAMLAQHQYQLLITDLTLVGCDGFAVIRKANELQPHLPKIVMTGADTIDDVVTSLKLGAYDFMRKPFSSLDEFRLQVERALKHYRLLVERDEHLQKIETMFQAAQKFNETLESEIANRTLELQEANRHLKTLDSMKNNLLMNISHELRTPLVSVRGYIELFNDGQLGEMPTGAAKFLGTCLRNLDKLLGLINNLIGYAETASGESDLAIDQVNLVDLLRVAPYEFGERIEERKVQIKLSFSDEIIMVNADRERLVQSISMLLDNAIKFNPAETEITLSAQRTGKQLVTIAVVDNGAGIAEQKLPYVFDRFYQCDSGSTRKFGGTGIGLSIARDNLRLMGSELRVSSVLGQGANFYWTMPVSNG